MDTARHYGVVMPAWIVSQAVIIAVGSELLTPDRLDTNSLFVTRALNELGISVRYKTVVSDDCDDVGLALKSAIRHAELVVVTGGLGPTDDDITREAISNVFGLPLEEDSDTAVTIRSLLRPAAWRCLTSTSAKRLFQEERSKYRTPGELRRDYGLIVRP